MNNSGNRTGSPSGGVNVVNFCANNSGDGTDSAGGRVNVIRKFDSDMNLNSEEPETVGDPKKKTWIRKMPKNRAKIGRHRSGSDRKPSKRNTRVALTSFTSSQQVPTNAIVVGSRTRRAKRKVTKAAIQSELEGLKRQLIERDEAIAVNTQMEI